MHAVNRNASRLGIQLTIVACGTADRHTLSNAVTGDNIINRNCADIEVCVSITRAAVSSHIKCNSVASLQIEDVTDSQ